MDVWHPPLLHVSHTGYPHRFQQGAAVVCHCCHQVRIQQSSLRLWPKTQAVQAELKQKNGYILPFTMLRRDQLSSQRTQAAWTAQVLAPPSKLAPQLVAGAVRRTEIEQLEVVPTLVRPVRPVRPVHRGQDSVSTQAAMAAQPS